MAVRVHTCYTLDCDRCGKPIGHDRSEPMPSRHYPTADAAIAALHGDPDVERVENPYLLLDGEQLADGAVLCSCCDAVRLCAERGHRWREPEECYCQAGDGCQFGDTNWHPWVEPCADHQRRRCRRAGCGGCEPVPVTALTTGAQ